MNSRQLRVNETGRSFPTEKTLCSMSKCDAWANHYSPGKNEVPMKETCIKVTNRSRAENPQALAWAFGLGSACAIRAPARQLKPVSLRTVPKVQALARLVIMAAYVPSNSVLCSSQPNMTRLTMPSSATPGTQRKPRSKQLKDLKNHVIKPDRMAASLRRSNLQNLSQLPKQLATPFFLPESSEKSQNTLGRCSARGPRWSC